jgi:hypothetical protein
MTVKRLLLSSKRIWHAFAILTMPRHLLLIIEDAIIVTAALGGRYLWVDCLCIFQDDDADKAEILPQMHLIYSDVEVTIMAAVEDCYAGLQGI